MKAMRWVLGKMVLVFVVPFLDVLGYNSSCFEDQKAALSFDSQRVRPVKFGQFRRDTLEDNIFGVVEAVDFRCTLDKLVFANRSNL